MASDLHIHTSFSDGKLSPEETVKAAKEAGLKCISVTDHDTTEGIVNLYENGLYPDKGIKIIPGIEMSANCPGKEVHILGYNIDIYNRALTDRLTEVGESRWTRFAEIVAKLNELNYRLTEGEVLTIAGDSKSISRSHIARALVKRGYFSSVREAFEVLLDKGKPAYVPHFRLETDEIIALIKGAGGKVVLAHPKLVKDDVKVLEIIERGIDGIEVFYPEHDEQDTARYMAFAKEHGLIVTGGSDFHGFTARHAVNLGEFTIDDSYAEQFFADKAEQKG